MKVTIQPSQLKGSIQTPASKSSMQRALAAGLLTKGTQDYYTEILKIIKQKLN